MTTVAVVAAASVAVVGVGSASAGKTKASGPVKLSVGGGMTVTVQRSKPLRVGAFNIGLQNTFDRDWNTALKARAKQLGIKLTSYDAAFNPTTQLHQLQNAIQQKKIDAALIFAVDSNVICKTVSHDMPKANILVSVSIAPMCNKALTQTAASPSTMWQPGTLNIVAGGNWIGMAQKFFNAAAAANPNAKRILDLGGVPTQASAIIGKKAFEKAFAGKTADVADTDFSTADAFKKTQSYLQAHPDTDLIVTTLAEDVTRGAINALKDAGKLGKVKMVTIGGTPYMLDQIKQGNIEWSYPLAPKPNAVASLNALVKAVKQGGKQPRFVDENPSWSPVTNPKKITKSNIAAWKKNAGY